MLLFVAAEDEEWYECDGVDEDDNSCNDFESAPKSPRNDLVLNMWLAKYKSNSLTITLI